jgi:antitoxin Phd
MAFPRARTRQASAPAIRNRRGEEPITISATDAKNKFGDLLDSVLQSGMALITRHETPKAVLLSMEEFRALSRVAETKLDSLSGDFDALIERMQTPKARAGIKAAFGASSKKLGKAALTVKDNRSKPAHRVKLPLVPSKRPGTLHLDNAKTDDLLSYPDVNTRLAEGLDDIRSGRVHGPFRSARALRRSLRRTKKTENS